MWALVKDGSVIVGPRSWLRKTFLRRLVDEGVDPFQVPSDPQAMDFGNGLHLLPVNETYPSINTTTQRYAGPSLTIRQNDVLAEYSAVDRPLHEVKAERRADVVEKYRSCSRGGIYLDLGDGPIRIESDHNSRQEVNEAVQILADRGGTLGVTTRSGVALTLNLTIATSLREALRDHEVACLENDKTLQTAIEDATTIDEVMAVDITSGWP